MCETCVDKMKEMDPENCSIIYAFACDAAARSGGRHISAYRSLSLYRLTEVGYHGTAMSPGEMELAGCGFSQSLESMFLSYRDLT
jgi:hypothetical protein